jgi:type III secretion protein V
MQPKPRGSLGIAPADAALFALVMAIVGMMIVPLPTWLLDLLLASNLALAMLLLITALRVPQGLALSTLPTVLLITTLLRLALNVSSTRLILLQADAGRVIRAFGEFVVQGNYAVGAVVFLIITIIQYLVVAKGSERIAEVGARFTLDALPGKQLAIDADLRAGAVSPDAARARRAVLERESQFYGAMDGAMKFVKGDAIAGMAIAVVSFIGGTAIGVFMQERAWAESARVYGLLTIGDALVSQIPSLVISTAAGLVVTRVSDHDRPQSLGEDIAAQLFRAPQVLGGTAVFLLALALVPGLPAVPFAVLAVGLGAAAYALQRAASRGSDEAPIRARVRLEVGWALQARERTLLASALQRAAWSCSERLALPVPSVVVAHEPGLAAGSFTLRLREVPVAQAEGLADVDALATAIARDFPPLFARHARELLDMADVQRKLDELAPHAQSLVPRAIGLAGLTAVLRQLLDEGVSLRAWERILEALHGAADRTAADQLALIRRALREQILHDLGRDLPVHRLDPLIEDAMRESPSPELSREIVGKVRLMLTTEARVNLLTQPDIRRSVFELLARDLPAVRVLSFDEIPDGASIEEREPVRI